MIRSTDARYEFGTVYTRMMPLNDDLTTPTPDRLIGGAGPFDFSSASNPAAVTLTIKIDNNAEETVNVDLSGAASISAVTVDELFAAINLASPTDMLASKDVTTNRIKLEYDGTESVGYVQVYGEVGQLAYFGQGFPLIFVGADTIQSINDTPIQKDEETITITDANGLDTEIITDGYRKGFTSTIVDTARDPQLRALIEGGSYNATTGEYIVPTSEDDKIYFFVEFFYARYTRGTNKEADLVGYIQKTYRSCKGTVGADNHAREWLVANYTITGTSYKDESGNITGDTEYLPLTVEEYQALDVYNV